MSLAQMAALGRGKRFKRPYVEEINARTPYLPQLYETRRADQYRKQQLGLGQRQFAQNKERLGIEKDRFEQDMERLGIERDRFEQEKKFGLEGMELAEEAARRARKKAKTAERMGYANLGLSAGLGAYNALGQPSLSDIGDWFSPVSDWLSPSEPIDSVGDWFSSPEAFSNVSDWLSPSEPIDSVGDWFSSPGDIFDNIVEDWIY